jgi:hypothetical protein
MGGACSASGEGRGVYRVFMVKPGWKRTLGKPRRRRKDNIKMDLKKVECGGSRDRWRALVNAVINLQVS